MSLLAIDGTGDGGAFHLRCANGIEFVFDSARMILWEALPESLDGEQSAPYLLGPILGFVLARIGITCLHATCLARGERALALVGRSGAGKSTTAVSLTSRGFQLVGDDIVPVIPTGDGFAALPGLPRIGLTERSARWLTGSVPTASMTADAELGKYRLHVGTASDTFRSDAVRLDTIYFLEPRSGERWAPVVRSLDTRAAHFRLVSNTYTARVDPSVRPREFEMLATLATTVRQRVVTAHASLDRLDALSEMISGDFARAESPTSPGSTRW